jgi:hypothetical protein
VVACDRSPDHIATIEDGLRTRFKWGLITDVQPPLPRDPPRHPAQEGRAGDDAGTPRGAGVHRRGDHRQRPGA